MLPNLSLLVYDGHCATCARFARMAQRLDRNHQLRLLPYADGAAQQLLRDQFGPQIGFTMYLFDGQTVYWARSAARQVVRLLGLPAPLAWLAFALYPALVRAVSWLGGRRQAVCMPGKGGCARAWTASGQAALTPEAQRRLAEVVG